MQTDFLYVRFIGDRSIDEKDFGKIQKDRVLEMSNWTNEIKNVEIGKEKGRRSEVRDAMIAANNHYAGFGPGTVNIFRNMIGMSELYWEDQPQLEEELRQRKKQEKDFPNDNSNILFGKKTKKRQTSLTEFTG